MPRHPLLSLFIICLILSLTASACVPARSKSRNKNSASSDTLDMPIPRADPGYIQQLERFSLLNTAKDRAKIVSGSELAWRAPGTHEGPDTLLGHADSWISINPMSFLSSSKRTTLDHLTDPALWPILREIGVKGIYVSPLFGSGTLWSGQAKEGLDTGEDTVQFSFAPTVGRDAQYRRFMGGVIDNQGLAGSDLLPAATGIGPDFFLAARNYQEYPGIYCMVEVPQDLWKLLPDVQSEWQGSPLSPEQVAALNAERILPKAMLGERADLAGQGGWATTGEVRGLDGNMRRWAYRYYLDPSRPVLNWEDPSRAANRILSGSSVFQVGLLGQALIGMKFDAFLGLDAAPRALPTDEEASAPAYTKLPLEPALPAAQSMSREIRRYGGWSWLRNDTLPLPALQEFMDAGADFVYDSAFSPAAEHALLTGDAGLLRFMVDEVLRLKVDTRRMVHATPGEEGLNYNFPHLEYLAEGENNAMAAKLRQETKTAMRGIAARQTPVPVKDGYLYTTSAGLVAMALDLSLDVGEDEIAKMLSTTGKADNENSGAIKSVQVLAHRSESNTREQVIRLDEGPANKEPSPQPQTDSSTTPAKESGEVPAAASTDGVPAYAGQAATLAMSAQSNSTEISESVSLPTTQVNATAPGQDNSAAMALSAQTSAAAQTNATAAQNEHERKDAIVAIRDTQGKAVRSKEDAIARGHGALIFFKAMQPGLLMLSGQDLAGTLPLRWSSMVDSAGDWDVRNASRGGYSLTLSSSSLMVSQQGMPRTESVYPSADRQVHENDSFLHAIGGFLRLRSTQGIARGSLIARPETRNKGSIALLSRLEDGRYLLAVTNFSQSTAAERISLAGIPGIEKALAHVTASGTSGDNYSVNGSTLSLTLGPWSGKAVFLGRAKI